MTQEDKELLLKDLCARLPYGVKISIPELWTSEKKIEVLNEIFKGDDGLYRVNDNGMIIEYVKPYLLPLSSMTKKQMKEYAHILVMSSNLACSQLIGETTQDWLDKIIEDLFQRGLALDATGLNIY